MESYRDYDRIDSDVEAELYASVYHNENLLTENPAVPESANVPPSTDINYACNIQNISSLGSQNQRGTSDEYTGTNSPSDRQQIRENQLRMLVNNRQKNLSATPDNLGKSVENITSQKRGIQQVQMHGSNCATNNAADLTREISSRPRKHRRLTTKHDMNSFEIESENQTQKSRTITQISTKKTIRSKQTATNDARKKTSPRYDSLHGHVRVTDRFRAERNQFSNNPIEPKSNRSKQYSNDGCSNSSLFIMGLSSDSSGEDESIYTAVDRQNKIKCTERVRNFMAKDNAGAEIVILDDSDENTNTQDRLSDSENSCDSIYEVPVPRKPEPPMIIVDDSRSSNDSIMDLESLSPKKLVQTYKEIAVQSLHPTLERATSVSTPKATNCADKARGATTLAKMSELRNRSQQFHILPTNDETQTEDVGSAVQSEIQMNVVNSSKSAAQAMNFAVSSKRSVIVGHQDSNVAMARYTAEIVKLSQKQPEVQEMELRREATSKTVKEVSLFSASVISKVPTKNINDDSNENEMTNCQILRDDFRQLGRLSIDHIHTAKDTSGTLNEEFISLQSTKSHSPSTNKSPEERKKRPVVYNESESKRQNPMKKSKMTADQVGPSSSSSQSKRSKKKSKKTSIDYFFKPMSEELKTFYNNSWGGETFDLDEIRKKMPQDHRFWIVPYSDVNYRQQQRYWTPGKCRNCQRPGHVKSMCPEKQKVPTCYMCGLPGHMETRCPSKICLNCGRSQHSYMKICSACRHTKCNLCHAKGHIADNCPDIWRRYHSTINSTDVNIPHRLSDVMKPSYKLSCCNCTKRGHDSSTCKNLRWSQYFPTPASVTTYTAGPAYPNQQRFDYTPTPSASYAVNNENRVDRNVENSLGLSISHNISISHQPAERWFTKTIENNRSEASTIRNEAEKLSIHNSINASKSSPDQLFLNVPNLRLQCTNITDSNRCSTVGDENPQGNGSNRLEQEFVNETTSKSPNTVQVPQTTINNIDLNNRQIESSDHPGISTERNTAMLNYINIEESEEVSSNAAQSTLTSLVLFSCQSIDFHLGKRSKYDVCSIPLFAKQCDALIKCNAGQQFLRNLTSLPGIQIKIVRSPDVTIVLSIHSHKSVHFPLQQIITDWLTRPADERNRFVQLNLPLNKSERRKLLMQKLDELKQDLGDPFELCNEIDLLKQQLQNMQNQVKTGKTVGASPKRDRVVDDLAKSQCRLNMILFGQAELNKGKRSVKFLKRQLRPSKQKDHEPLRTVMYLLALHHFNKIFTAYTPPNLPQLLNQYSIVPTQELVVKDTVKKPNKVKKSTKLKRLNRIKKPKKVKEDNFIKFIRDVQNFNECNVQSGQRT